MIATLDDVKGKLDLPASDTSRDDALTLALESASAKVLDLCRYSEADVTGHQQLFRNVQFNRDLFLDLRPINVAAGHVVVFEGRGLGQPDWSELTGDVLDAQEGRVIVLGASAWWPPQRTLQPAFQRWRDPIWPQIRVTYDVVGVTSNPASELIDAAASLAAFWYDRDLAGAKEDSRIGQVQVTWLNEALPSTLLEKISKHVRGESAAGGVAGWV